MKKFFLAMVVLSAGPFTTLKAMWDETVLNELQTEMTKLETKKNPHALDEEMPVLAGRLAEVFHQRYPDVHLLEYEDAKDLLLAHAGTMGAAPLYNAGLQQPGETYATMLQRRLNGIPPGPLTEATHTLLPIAYFLNQDAHSLSDLIKSSVPVEGTSDSAYYSDLLRDSIAFLAHPPAAPTGVEKLPSEAPVAAEPVDADLAWALEDSLKMQEQVPETPALSSGDEPSTPVIEDKEGEELALAIAESLKEQETQYETFASGTQEEEDELALAIVESLKEQETQYQIASSSSSQSPSFPELKRTPSMPPSRALGFPIDAELAAKLAKQRAETDKGIS